MKTYQIIGKKIKQIRESKGKTLGDVAKVLGYSSDTAVHLIEKGERKISIEQLVKLGNYFKIPLSELTDGQVETEKKVDLFTALRAEDLSDEDIDKINDYINYIKSKINVANSNAKPSNTGL